LWPSICSFPDGTQGSPSDERLQRCCPGASLRGGPASDGTMHRPSIEIIHCPCLNSGFVWFSKTRMFLIREEKKIRQRANCTDNRGGPPAGSSPQALEENPGQLAQCGRAGAAVAIHRSNPKRIAPVTKHCAVGGEETNSRVVDVSRFCRDTV
jgi:hypothetical protein